MKYLNYDFSTAMKFLALSVILALAVSLSGAMSVDQALHQEWELFKVTHHMLEMNSQNIQRQYLTMNRLPMARATRNQKTSSA